jgi:hypothetical protein
MSKVFVSTLRPGLLVNIKTSIKGNVSYLKTREGETTVYGDGSEVTDWETERTVKDAAEQKLATQVRSAARNLITRVCAASEFGLLCPEEKRENLNAAFSAARQLCADFNATSSVTSVKFNAIAGRIAPDDLEAVRAINSEVRDLIAEMQAGIDGLDSGRIQDAASRVKKIGNMLSTEAQARIEDAVKDVRAMARKMTEAGIQAATEVDAEVINKLAATRTAFLDLDDAVEVAAPADTSGRALDLAPHDEVIDAGFLAVVRDLELEDMLA